MNVAPRREHRSGGFSGDGRILLLQTDDDWSKWPFRVLRRARVDQPRVFPLRKMHRATGQRLDANLANQRSRHPGEVIVGAARRSGERLLARGRPRVLRQHFKRELPQRRLFKGRHVSPRLRAWGGIFRRH